MAMSARELLANLPVKMAEGGSISEKQKQRILAAEQKYLADPTKRSGAQLYNQMLESGVSVQDLLDAGVQQSTIDQVFTVQEPVPVSQFIQPTTAQSSLAGLEAQEREAAILRGQELVNRLQQGGIDADERRRLQRAATEYGVTFQDMLNAGIDPSILFDVQAPAPQPQPTGPIAGPSQPDVYTPPAVQPRAPGIDQTFRDSPVRERITGVDQYGNPIEEFDPLTGSPTGYRYTPAARLTPATGSGLSWTPPVVTSRPRQLLDVGTGSPYGGYRPSYSQMFARSREEQDQALMGQYQTTKRPYSYAEYSQWRNRMRSGEFNDGNVFNKEKFDKAFAEWNASTGATAQGSGTTDQNVTAQGSNQIPADAAGYYRIDPVTGQPIYEKFTSGVGPGGRTTSIGQTVAPKTVTPGGAIMFSEGGLIKKPEGVAEETATPEPETESAQMLERLNTSSPANQYPLTAQGTVDWSQMEPSYLNKMVSLVQGGGPEAYLRRDAKERDPLWTGPAQITRREPVERPQLPRDDVPDSIGQARAMLLGLSEIPGTVADYAKEVAQSDQPLRTLGKDASTVGSAMLQGLTEDPVGFMLDMTPGIGQKRAAEAQKTWLKWLLRQKPLVILKRLKCTGKCQDYLCQACSLVSPENNSVGRQSLHSSPAI